MPPRRLKAVTPTFVVDVNGDPIEIGGHVGLYIDLQLGDAAPMRGDWIATPAGSRYLVDDVRHVRAKKHAQVKRYRLRCMRLPKDTAAPADIRVIWLRWYPRARAGSR